MKCQQSPKLIALMISQSYRRYYSTPSKKSWINELNQQFLQQKNKSMLSNYNTEQKIDIQNAFEAQKLSNSHPRYQIKINQSLPMMKSKKQKYIVIDNKFNQIRKSNYHNNEHQITNFNSLYLSKPYRKNKSLQPPRSILPSPKIIDSQSASIQPRKNYKMLFKSKADQISQKNIQKISINSKDKNKITFKQKIKLFNTFLAASPTKISQKIATFSFKKSPISSNNNQKSPNALNKDRKLRFFEDQIQPWFNEIN